MSSCLEGKLPDWAKSKTEITYVTPRKRVGSGQSGLRNRAPILPTHALPHLYRARQPSLPRLLNSLVLPLIPFRLSSTRAKPTLPRTVFSRTHHLLYQHPNQFSSRASEVEHLVEGAIYHTRQASRSRLSGTQSGQHPSFNPIPRLVGHPGRKTWSARSACDIAHLTRQNPATPRAGAAAFCRLLPAAYSPS